MSQRVTRIRDGRASLPVLKRTWCPARTEGEAGRSGAVCAEGEYHTTQNSRGGSLNLTHNNHELCKEETFAPPVLLRAIDS